MVQFLKRNIAGFASMTEEALIDAVGVGLYEGGDSDMHWIVNVQADRSLGATNAVSLALVDGLGVKGSIFCSNLPVNSSRRQGGRGSHLGRGR